MREIWQDVRYGSRMLLNKPAFTAAAVIVLALGIGANTAIFSLVNAFLLKPLMIREPDQIAGLYSRDTKTPDSYRAFSYPNYVEVRSRNAVFTDLAAHHLSMVGLAEGDVTRRIFADVVSSNFFATLGAPLYRGRLFTPEEEQPGAGNQVTIVSYNYWQQSGADPDLLGKTLRVNNHTFTIIGITAKGFTGTVALISCELYLPLGVYSLVQDGANPNGTILGARDHNDLIVFGRLRPGFSLASAVPPLAVLASQLEKAFPKENRNQTFTLSKLSRLGISDGPSSDTGLALPAALMLAMAAVVLLIASLNLANMMLARGAARRKEIAIRLAIGGSRSRIVRQLFTEGLLLALVGGVAGLGVAYMSTSLLVNSLARLTPFAIVYTAGPDARVLAVTAAFCLLSTVVFSLGPAWKLSRPAVVDDLKESAGEDSTGARRTFSRSNLLVMAQVSLSLMMLTSAGLFVRSAVRAANMEPGFLLDSQVLAEVDAGLAGYDENRGRQTAAALLPRLQAVPGVQSVAFAATVPFGMMNLGREIYPAEPGSRKDASPSGAVLVRYNMVSAYYFQTLGIPLLRGRSFLPSDLSPSSTRRFVVLDKLAAEQLWPGANALGRQIRFGVPEPGKPPVEAEVVGIVGNIRDHIVGRPLEPHAYIPFGQEYQSGIQIHLKIAPASPPAQARILDSIRQEIRATDSRLPVLSLRTLRDHLDTSMDLWIVRTGARMLAVLGLIALLLATVGLYGLKAYTVARRTREIGIRMALGARPEDNLRMVLREGLLVTFIGTGVGLALALAAGRALAGMLYEVQGADPLVFVTAPLLLTGISLVACYLPARRASRVSPLVALRYE